MPLLYAKLDCSQDGVFDKYLAWSIARGPVQYSAVQYSAEPLYTAPHLDWSEKRDEKYSNEKERRKERTGTI